MTDQIENMFKIFSMFDMKSLSESLTRINVLIEDNFNFSKTNKEDNKIIVLYIEELPIFSTNCNKTFVK
jgi:hypothetical protein